MDLKACCVENGNSPLSSSNEYGDGSSSNLDLRELVARLVSFIKSYTNLNAIISARDEWRALVVTTKFKEVHGRDHNNIELRNHLVFRSSNSVSEWRYL